MSNIKYIIFYLIFFVFNQLHGQEIRTLSLEQAIAEALENNLLVKAANTNYDAQKAMISTSFDLPKTSISLMQGQYNTRYNDNNVTISQSFALPGLYASQKSYLTILAEQAGKQLEMQKNEIRQQVKLLYLHLQYLENKKLLLTQQDSIYANFAKAGAVRYKTGESNLLEKANAETQLLEIRNLIELNEAEIKIAKTQLKTFLNNPIDIQVSNVLLSKKEINNSLDTNTLQQNPFIGFWQTNYQSYESLIQVEKRKRLPEISLGYFNQSLTGYQNTDGNDKYFGPGYRFQGFLVGVNVPIWMKAQNARINATSLSKQSANQHLEFYQLQLKNDYQNAVLDYKKWQNTLSFYENSMLKQADLILNNAQKAFKSGEISYLEFSLALSKVLTIRNNHLDHLLKYNQAIIQIEFYAGI